MWLVLLGCASHLAPEPGASGFVPITSIVPPLAAPGGDCPRVDPALRAAVGRIEVVVDVDGPVSLPAGFVASAQTDRSVQGFITVEELCALGALDGVVWVRAPWLASPK